MEEAASRSQDSADSSSSGEAKEDHPPRHAFQAFGAAELGRDHCNEQRNIGPLLSNAPAQERGQNSTGFIGAARRLSARRSARRRRKLAMKEPAPGLSGSADSSEHIAHPPREVFAVFRGAEMDRDHCSEQTRDSAFLSNVPTQEEGINSLDYIDDFSFAHIGDVRLIDGDFEDEEDFYPVDGSAREGLFNAIPGGLLEYADFFSNSSDAGKHSSYERRAAKPLGANTQMFRGLTTRAANYGDLHPSERGKRYWLAFALLLSFVGITLAAFLTTGKNAGNDNVGLMVGDPRNPRTVAKKTMETSTFTTHDLSSYGYPYAQGTSSSGWVTWLPGRRYKDINHVSYDGSDGISSLEDCAAKCQESKAPTASWSGKYKTCWCNFSVVTNLCREPCVEDEYIDFGTLPIEGFHYCKKSVCDKGLFLYDPEYCEVDVGFDQDACDAKKEEVEHTHGPN